MIRLLGFEVHWSLIVITVLVIVGLIDTFRRSNAVVEKVEVTKVRERVWVGSTWAAVILVVSVVLGGIYLW